MVDRTWAAVLVVAAFGGAVLAGRWAVQRRQGPTVEVDVQVPEAGPTPAEPSAAQGGGTVWRVPVGSAPTQGAADALVTLVLFTDLGPSGRRLLQALERIETAQRGDVRFAVRLLSNAGSRATAEALFAAHQQGRFFELLAALGDNAPDGLQRAQLQAAAREASLEPAAFEAALSGGKASARADADMRLAAMLGLSETTLFVNGVRLDGRATESQLDKLVAAQKRRAEEVVRGGVARAQVYADLIRNARGSAQAPSGATAPPRRREDPDAVYRVEVDGAPSRGPADALVTIIELADFQCPFCLRAEVTLRELLERHPRDLRLVWRNSPLSSHPEGAPAAAAAMAAGAQGKFWPMHDALFAAQRELGAATYARLAGQLGLDLRRFRADSSAPATRDAILQEAASGNQLGAIGTPTFFVNGKRLRGFRSPDALVELVERELERATALVREQHVARADVYDRLTKDGARQSVYLPTDPAAPIAPHRSATVQDLRPSSKLLPDPHSRTPDPTSGASPTQP